MYNTITFTDEEMRVLQRALIEMKVREERDLERLRGVHRMVAKVRGETIAALSGAIKKTEEWL